MLSPKKLYIYRLLSLLMPETSCFGLKRSLLRWAGAEVGQNVRICSSATILGCGELIIGDDTWIGQHCLIMASSKIEIGKNVDVAPMVYLGTGTHVPQFDKERCAGEGLNKDIKIGDGCWLCARTTILPGVTVGNMTIVGAGAVVIKDLPGGVTAVGVPAKVLNAENENCSFN